MKQGYAIVRYDMAPQEWWDGYYFGPELPKSMAEYWSEKLGIACFALPISYPQQLPESGYHANKMRH